MKVERYEWEDIPSRVPTGSGIYAWYSSMTLSTFDIQNVTEETNQLQEDGESIAAADRVRRFLIDNLFDRFSPPPYEVDLSGELIAHFRGTAHFEDSLDPNVFLNLAKDPSRLHVLKKALEAATPHFVAPLYIGMSKNLRQRLGGHKSLIENGPSSTAGLPAEYAEGDQSFASEIKKRRFSPPSLSVHILVFDEDPGPVRDVEYLLNRTTFPILGRR